MMLFVLWCSFLVSKFQASDLVYYIFLMYLTIGFGKHGMLNPSL